MSKFNEFLNKESYEDTGEDEFALVADEDMDDLDSSLNSVGLDAASEDCVNSIMSLESINNSIRLNMEGIGFTAPVAKVLDIAVQNFMTNLSWGHPSGLSSHVFESQANQAYATQIVMENIGQAINSGIKKIIEFCKKIMQYVYAQLMSITGSARSMSEQARKLKKRSKEIENTNSPLSGKVITDKGLLRFFSQENQVMNPSQIISAYKSYSKNFAHGFSESYIKQCGHGVATVVNYAIKGESKEKVLSATDVIIKEMRQKTFSALDDNSKYSNNIQDVFIGILPFGSKEMKLTLTKEKDLYSGLHVKIGNSDGGPITIKGDAHLEPLSFALITELLGLVENAMDFGIYKSHNKTIGYLKEVDKAIANASAQLASIQKKSNEQASSTNYSLHFLRDISSGIMQAVIAVNAYELTVSNGLLDYIDKSIKCYK